MVEIRRLKATAFGQSWVHSSGTAPQLDFGIEEGVTDGCEYGEREALCAFFCQFFQFQTKTSKTCKNTNAQVLQIRVDFKIVPRR